MKRRTDLSNGFVNFPVKDKEYKSSGEGGMSVMLVVTEGKKPWSLCCTNYPHTFMGEVLLWDDTAPPPKDDPGPTSIKEMQRQEAQYLKWMERHFPRYPGGGDGVRATPHQFGRMSFEKYLSMAYLACILLGTTGWSGWNNKKGYWHCSFEDLTSDGKKLYNLTQKLYPGCTLRLLTWLDT